MIHCKFYEAINDLNSITCSRVFYVEKLPASPSQSRVVIICITLVIDHQLAGYYTEKEQQGTIASYFQSLVYLSHGDHVEETYSSLGLVRV